MVFVFHVTLQEHVIKALYDLMVKNPSRYVTILPSVVALDTEIIAVLVCHVISQYHVIKVSFAFMDRSPSVRQFIILLKFVAIGTSVVEI